MPAASGFCPLRKAQCERLGIQRFTAQRSHCSLDAKLTSELTRFVSERKWSICTTRLSLWTAMCGTCRFRPLGPRRPSSSGRIIPVSCEKRMPPQSKAGERVRCIDGLQSGVPSAESLPTAACSAGSSPSRQCCKARCRCAPTGCTALSGTDCASQAVATIPKSRRP